MATMYTWRPPGTLCSAAIGWCRSTQSPSRWRTCRTITSRRFLYWRTDAEQGTEQGTENREQGTAGATARGRAGIHAARPDRRDRADPAGAERRGNPGGFQSAPRTRSGVGAPGRSVCAGDSQVLPEKPALPGIDRAVDKDQQRPLSAPAVCRSGDRQSGLSTDSGGAEQDDGEGLLRGAADGACSEWSGLGGGNFVDRHRRCCGIDKRWGGKWVCSGWSWRNGSWSDWSWGHRSRSNRSGSNRSGGSERRTGYPRRTRSYKCYESRRLNLVVWQLDRVREPAGDGLVGRDGTYYGCRQQRDRQFHHRAERADDLPDLGIFVRSADRTPEGGGCC